jgi:hypothetical protein
MVKLEHIKVAAWLVTAFLIFGALPYYYRQARINADRVSQVVSYALSQRDSAIMYKNRYGQAVYQIQTQRLDQETMAKLRRDLVDITSRFNGLNKKLNNVEQLSQVTLTAVGNLQGSVTDTVVVRDSVSVNAFQFAAQDKWFTVTGLVIPEQKKVEVTPSFTANVYAVSYWQRKRILGLRIGKKEYKSEITSDNPYLKFSDYKVVSKKWQD